MTKNMTERSEECTIKITKKMVQKVEDMLWREFGDPSDIATANPEYDETAMEILESALREGGFRYLVSSECLSLSGSQGLSDS